MKKPINQLRTGVYLSYINLGVSGLIPFFYTPAMLRILGQQEYGIYSLANSVISYLSLLSFGFGSAIIRYITKYRVEGKKGKEEQCFGFFLTVYFVFAVIVLLCGALISANVDSIFKNGLSRGELDKMKLLILIMTLNMAISFPLSVVSSVITAHERYVYRKCLDIMLTLGLPIMNLIMLYMGFASVGMAVGSTLLQLVLIPLNVFYCAKVLKVRPSYGHLDKQLVREMIGFSIYVFIGSIVDMLFWSTDKVILGMVVNSTAIAIYNVGCTFNAMVMNLSISLSGVLIPKITGMVVKNTKTQQLTEIFIRVGRLQYAIIALIVSGFAVFGREFITLWAGSDYKDSYLIALLTMVPLCVPLIQNTGISIITAQNKHGFRSISYLIIAIINVISTWFVVPYLGGVGAALCSCIAYITGQVIVMNIYYYKVTKIDIPLFWSNIIKMSIVPIVMLVVGLLLNQRIEYKTWISLFIAIICYSMIYYISMYSLIFNEYEKDVIRKPVFALISMVKVMVSANVKESKQSK